LVHEGTMFVLAHLSDPHLGPIPTPRLAELFNKRGLGLINWYRKRHRHHRADVLDAILHDMRAQKPDHVALTGDLVNISLESEFARAAQWLDEVGKPADVTLVPGNHDAYVRRVAGSAAQHWGEFMRGDPLPDPPPQAGEGKEIVFPFVRRRGPIALIGLSTSLPTGPFMATGRLGGQQMARFAEILLALSREGVFRVVLIHHPPVPNRGHYMKRLTDGPLFRALIAEHGAELVLHGHNHEQQLVWLEGPQGRIPSVGVPSASAIVSTHDEPAAYNLYSIGGAPGVWTCEMTVRGFSFGREGITQLKREKLK
jgi:3',5'-cyclic AMP phosphodiesterase CpdA